MSWGGGRNHKSDDCQNYAIIVKILQSHISEVLEYDIFLEYDICDVTFNDHFKILLENKFSILDNCTYYRYHRALTTT